MELQDLISPFTKLIAIDEAQFFDKLILSELRRYLNKGIDVAVSGLDKDYRARPFGIIPNLIEMAHHKHHLKAVCQQCGADAEYSYRMTQNHVLVLIGAENHYEPRCEKCFNINQ
jgi:thymidine kinase